MSSILITGSGSGIGLTTVLHFGRMGYEVYASLPLLTSNLLHEHSNERMSVDLLNYY